MATIIVTEGAYSLELMESVSKLMERGFKEYETLQLGDFPEPQFAQYHEFSPRS
jgi:hypothetical protein